MASPWLDVPLAEYEGHMKLAGQASMLDQIFGRALRTVRPRSVAVLGAAGGNGFGHLAECKVARTVALDLNPAYLKELERRYRDLVQDLEGEPVGALNKVFGYAYRVRLAGKNIKEKSHFTYYVLKYLIISAILYLIFA